MIARYVLDGICLDQDREFQAIYLERAGDGPAVVANGRAAPGLDSSGRATLSA